MYIGQTMQKNPKMRWYDHQAKARCGVNQPLANAIRKYGVEKLVVFTFNFFSMQFLFFNFFN